jgi:hypothetical protein
VKPFDPLTFDLAGARAGVEAFATFLGPADRELGERGAILPFFRRHPHLAALASVFNPWVFVPTHIKLELELFGDHACDLAVGNAGNGQFCFVEFEAATADGVFKRGRKGVPEWSARLEHGFSQVVDWFYTLDDMKATGRFRGQFGTNLADYTGAVVVGRRGFLTPAEHERLLWRWSRNVQVAGRRVTCLTFDDLLDAFREWVVYREGTGPPP